FPRHGGPPDLAVDFNLVASFFFGLSFSGLDDLAGSHRRWLLTQSPSSSKSPSSRPSPPESPFAGRSALVLLFLRNFQPSIGGFRGLVISPAMAIAAAGVPARMVVQAGTTTTDGGALFDLVSAAIGSTVVMGPNMRNKLSEYAASFSVDPFSVGGSGMNSGDWWRNRNGGSWCSRVFCGRRIRHHPHVWRCSASLELDWKRRLFQPIFKIHVYDGSLQQWR
ncbi:unnamed protein product, partial [Linum tenue]